MVRNLSIGMLLAILGISSSWAGHVKITGKVTDADRQPLEFVNVVLYSLPDSTLVAGTVTNAHGDFSLAADEGKMGFLKVSFIGYETQSAPAVSGQTIMLKENGQALQEVVVKGSSKLYRQKNGSIVANVRNTVLETLPTAHEVIARLPFISVQNGDFSVFGKGTPVIYINDRLLRDKEELTQLAPHDIKNIEVVTMPGAKYDASVKAMIRITTVKAAGEGWSGNLRATLEQHSVFSHNEYAALNYRSGAWDLFGSAYQVADRHKTSFNSAQELLLANENQRYAYRAFENSKYNNITPIVGVNYNPNNKHSAGVRYTFVHSKWDADGENNIRHDASGETIQQLMDGERPKNNHKLNAYYVGKLSKNWSLNVNADWVKGHEDDEMDAVENRQTDDAVRTNSERDYDLYGGKGFFSYRMGNAVLEAGGEYVYTRMVQTYAINKPELGIRNTDDKSLQNRGAAFVSYQAQWDKWGVAAGVRYEHIDMDYYENGVLSNEQSKTYNQLFPNLSVMYMQKGWQLSAGFERKVKYPYYSQLRSNVQYSSPILYESGNPTLKPKIENAFSLMAMWKDVQAMAGYTICENDIVTFVEQFEDKAVVLFHPRNVKRTKNASFGISYGPTVGFWRPQFEAGGMWQWLNLDNETRGYSKPLFSGSWKNTFSLPKEWVARLDVEGHTAGHNGIARVKPSWGIDLHLSKRMIKKRLTISLTAYDLFKTQTNNWEMNYGKVNLYYDKNIDSRGVRLTVSYRFNSTKNKYQGKQSSDEINRL